MNELRLILLAIGAIVIGCIYYFGREQRPPGFKRLRRKTPIVGLSEPEPVDATMERDLERLGALISADRDAQPGALADCAVSLPADPEKIITLFLRSRDGVPIPGNRIAEVVDKVGLVFGDKGIFHRLHQPTDDRGTAIFSMANMTNPGSFDERHLEQTAAEGLCLFLTLPNTLSALDAWDAMHAAGQRLASLLDTELLDESQSTLSRQRIAHIREEMRAYDRQQEMPTPRH